MASLRIPIVHRIKKNLVYSNFLLRFTSVRLANALSNSYICNGFLQPQRQLRKTHAN